MEPESCWWYLLAVQSREGEIETANSMHDVKSPDAETPPFDILHMCTGQISTCDMLQSSR